MTERQIARLIQLPPLTQGFAGPGHMMTPVIDGGDFALTDPFLMLADDHLELGDRPVGGPHPHAGFETVTLLVEGEIYDRHEGGTIRTGGVQWMTAGRGIVHGEDVFARGRARILQLWLTLPKRERWTAPDYQDLPAESIPVGRRGDATVRVYSGVSGGLRGPAANHVPVTIVEAVIAPRGTFTQELPASYNGFVLPLAGAVTIGDTTIDVGEVGWLERPATGGDSAVVMYAGGAGARVVLYAGEPQGDAIVQHGPFVGDSREDITRSYAEFRKGLFPRMSELAHARKAAGHVATTP